MYSIGVAVARHCNRAMLVPIQTCLQEEMTDVNAAVRMGLPASCSANSSSCASSKFPSCANIETSLLKRDALRWMAVMVVEMIVRFFQWFSFKDVTFKKKLPCRRKPLRDIYLLGVTFKYLRVLKPLSCPMTTEG